MRRGTGRVTLIAPPWPDGGLGRPLDPTQQLRLAVPRHVARKRAFRPRRLGIWRFFGDRRESDGRRSHGRSGKDDTAKAYQFPLAWSHACVKPKSFAKGTVGLANWATGAPPRVALLSSSGKK
jgi:hypothetical protein